MDDSKRFGPDLTNILKYAHVILPNMKPEYGKEKGSHAQIVEHSADPAKGHSCQGAPRDILENEKETAI